MLNKKRGGYSGSKPASEMGPPRKTPSATIKPKNVVRITPGMGPVVIKFESPGPLKSGETLEIELTMILDVEG